MNIDRAELKKVSYLDWAAIGDRRVNLMPLWDGSRWTHWLPTSKGLFETHFVDAALSDYVAISPARSSDLWILLIDLMWQRASWPEICRHISAISDDFHNMATSVAKIKHFFFTRSHLPHGIASSFVATELEYVLTLCRAVFDLLQEAVSTIWNTRIHLLDPAAEGRRKQRHLPRTFSKVVLKHKEGPKTQADIEADSGLHPAIAEQYAKSAAFFFGLREARNNIVHHGHASPIVFDTEKGFAVSPNEEAFSDFHGWRDEHRYNETLMSLLPWLAHIILGTMSSCNGVAAAFASVIAFPPELAPGYRVFVRGYNNEALVDLLNVQRGGAAWWSAAPSVALEDDDKQRPSTHQDIELAAYYRYIDRVARCQVDSELDDWLAAERELRGGRQ